MESYGSAAERQANAGAEGMLAHEGPSQDTGRRGHGVVVLRLKCREFKVPVSEVDLSWQRRSLKRADQKKTGRIRDKLGGASLGGARFT